MQQRRLGVDGVRCAGLAQEPCRGLVTEAAAAEVDADPDAVILVDEQVDVVVARADGTELLARHLLERRDGLQLPGVVVEQFVVDVFLVAAADAEGERLEDVVHDRGDLGAHLVGVRVETHGLVTAGDVIADARGRDVLAVGDYAADRHRVPEVVVRHERHAIRSALAGGHLHLGLLVGLAAPVGNGVVEEFHGRFPLSVSPETPC